MFFACQLCILARAYYPILLVVYMFKCVRVCMAGYVICAHLNLAHVRKKKKDTGSTCTLQPKV